MNEVSLRRSVPTATPQLTKNMQKDELTFHRANIAAEVKAVLSAYFQPHESDEVKAIQLAWWCDELQDWTREQCVWALREWNRRSPRLRPTPGDIHAILIETRGKREAERMKAALPAKAPEPPREPISEAEKQHRAEVAASILKGKFAV